MSLISFSRLSAVRALIVNYLVGHIDLQLPDFFTTSFCREIYLDGSNSVGGFDFQWWRSTLTLGQIRACTGEEPLNLGDPSLQCHSPLGKAGGLVGLHGAGSGGPACWLRCESLVGLLASAESDWGCLWCCWWATHASIDTSWHSQPCVGPTRPPFQQISSKLRSMWIEWFGGDVSGLHFERCSSSSLSALWLVFFGRQDLATKKTIFKGQFQLLHVVAHSWWNFSGLHGQFILDRFFCFGGLSQ